jgi:glycosyltransferase involved in cell wall biosynthesis
LIETLRPDVLISSHEPAVTLELGLSMAARVPAWLADLGDPVLTPYTPSHWRRRAWRLEEAVCRAASAVSVTTDDTRELLRTRHEVDGAKMFVLSQGFDDSTPRVPPSEALAQGQSLRLLYSGRFYPFRDPAPLLEAVVALGRVSLTVVAPEVKPELLAYTERSEGRIVFTGEQPHERVLAWQRECDVLVNIGNALQAQVPGKLFEYLGSGKPILHCQSADEDPAVALLAQWGCGWVCRNERASLQALLADLLASPAQMVDAAAGEADAIARHGWSRLGGELFERCERLVAAATLSTRH